MPDKNDMYIYLSRNLHLLFSIYLKQNILFLFHWFILLITFFSFPLSHHPLPFSSYLCPGTVQSVMYNLRGEQALLGPSALPQPPDSILWKCNGNKVVEFTGSEENPYGSYEGRVTLNWHTAQLQISDLRFEDSGKYEYELFMEGNLLQSSYDLEVIGKCVKAFTYCLFLKKKKNCAVFC